jgi:carboxylesterase type B
VRDGSQYGPKCIQVDLLMGNLVGSEDCLTLNVYSPVQVGKNTFRNFVKPGFF